MSDWFTYMLQSSVTLAALYLVYALFLSKDTFFAMNRFFLAGALMCSAILPLLHFDDLARTALPEYTYILDTIVITPSKVSGALSANPSFFQLLTVAYLTGSAIFLARFVVQLGQLGLLIRRYGVTKKEGLRLVLIHREYSPFSFFNIIFINAKEYRPGHLYEIIEHEKVHIRQMHTFDLLLMELMTIIQWFNPFIWMYRNSLKGIHEYLADEGVLLKGMRISEYQQRLLNQAMGIQLNDLTNNFNHSLLKRRFIMMTKKRSGFAARLKPVLAFPVLILMALTFSFTGGNKVIAQDTDKKTEMTAKPDQVAADDATTYETVARKPEFKGGEGAFINYIVTNVSYPKEAKEKGITGKVYVEFMVDKTGKIMNAKVKQSVDPLLDAEALRVISSMPDWEPGFNDKNKPVKVIMVVPIMFALDGSKGEKK